MRRAATIRSKLVLLLAIPLVALVVLACLGVAWTTDSAARSRATVRGAETAIASTKAALEVARERGLSTAVLADPGGARSRSCGSSAARSTSPSATRPTPRPGPTATTVGPRSTVSSTRSTRSVNGSTPRRRPPTAP